MDFTLRHCCIRSNGELTHDLVPAFARGASHQYYKSHTEALEVHVLVDLLLVNNVRKHVHSNDREDEKQKHNQRADICDTRQDNDEGIDKHAEIPRHSHEPEYAHDSQGFDNFENLYEFSFALTGIHDD